MNAKTEMSVAAQLRALADKLDGGASGSAVAPKWEHGDAEWSPPDEFGRVQLRHVEMVLVPRYGAVLSQTELTVGGEKTNTLAMPRWFFIREAASTDFASWNVGNSAMREPANAAWTWKYSNVGRVEADNIIPGTLATNDPLPVFLRKLDAACEEYVVGVAFHLYGLAHRD